MTAEELINQMIPPLKGKDGAHKAMLWMEELRTNELPVVENEEFKGLLTEDMMLEENDVTISVGDFRLVRERCYVNLNSHFYDVLKVASDYNSNTVAVIDQEGKYQGAITINDIVAAFAQSAAAQMPGGVLVLSLLSKDYSLTEIARLIEENNAKILSSSIKEDDFDRAKLRLTLKINRPDLTSILATLERFGYRVVAHFQENKIEERQKDRVDMLLKYLDI